MLKQVFGAATAALVLAAFPGPAEAQMQAPKSTSATITGHVIDVSCKFGFGLSGADHKMCTEVCADKGIPLAILGTDGKLYIPTSTTMPGGSENARLKPFAEQKVTVSGKVFDAGGAKAIQVESIKKAE